MHVTVYILNLYYPNDCRNRNGQSQCTSTRCDARQAVRIQHGTWRIMQILPYEDWNDYWGEFIVVMQAMYPSMQYELSIFNIKSKYPIHWNKIMLDVMHKCLILAESPVISHVLPGSAQVILNVTIPRVESWILLINVTNLNQVVSCPNWTFTPSLG